ncbi:MAG: HPr family phosphocarrier protein [Phycisphaerales bacterium]|nr:HPr family phosphocarrier protein [Phycisphaerales bacterium]
MAFVEEAMRFESNVAVRRCDSDEPVDGKSILQMLMLAGTLGSEIEITTIGSDEQATLAALLALIDAHFGEEE